MKNMVWNMLMLKKEIECLVFLMIKQKNVNENICFLLKMYAIMQLLSNN